MSSIHSLREETIERFNGIFLVRFLRQPIHPAGRHCNLCSVFNTCTLLRLCIPSLFLSVSFRSIPIYSDNSFICHFFSVISDRFRSRGFFAMMIYWAFSPFTYFFISLYVVSFVLCYLGLHVASRLIYICQSLCIRRNRNIPTHVVYKPKLM